MIAIPRYDRYVAITTSLTVDFAPPFAGHSFLCDAIYVGGAGTVPVVAEDGTATTFTCTAGQILPVRARRVNTGGTGSLMIAMYQL